MKKLTLGLLVIAFLISCKPQPEQQAENTSQDYWSFENRDDQFTGGIKMIPIQTEKGEFKVWTKRVGNNPTKKVLLLHGGPGMTHEAFSCFDGYFPQEEIEYIYYDQLGSYHSDQPDDLSLWTTERFVEEVEQVRQALGLDSSNFYLLGQSWGGILAMEYALKYQDNMKGLIISNMMSSVPEYNAYAQEVLGPQMDPEVYKEIKAMEDAEDFTNPRYGELLMNHYYTEHVLRLPMEEWPEAVMRTLNHANNQIYVHMQGYSEFGITGDATLKEWDVKDRLKELSVPTLVIGAQYDTMDPKHMEWMAGEVQNGRYLYCPNGSHLSQYDDQKNYFSGVIDFVNDVDSGSF
ncbi:proline iminopeptidase-family hydrolase [Lentiprolixibacter aurantiacus]|uniref:Proline iminopeptidase-family hydrolase n=1 Tax=Lentiprolixibacter aurantiacus TaxID=2993939 RepID=A0AAE3SM83_9FLAO|nr:proline iminopeptidase-family hydrolase [Lentiprolixibacter aurantiacus]MCX2718304.1 proline iminopeptidase-family hydrolase [Lentiprolixibacter aurantiacus]